MTPYLQLLDVFLFRGFKERFRAGMAQMKASLGSASKKNGRERRSLMAKVVQEVVYATSVFSLYFIYLFICCFFLYYLLPFLN
jgi:hypothetical protein